MSSAVYPTEAQGLPTIPTAQVRPLKSGPTVGYEEGPGVWLGMVFKDKVSLYSPGTHYVNQVGLELTDIQACLCFQSTEVKGLEELTATGTVLEQGTMLVCQRHINGVGWKPPT